MRPKSFAQLLTGQASSDRAAAKPARVLGLAWPVIFSNVTVPLIGLVDTAIMGHMPEAAYIGGVALGGLIFNFVYWSFGFLRMGTTGLTAQAFGRLGGSADAVAVTELRAVLLRALLLGGACGLALVVLQWPIATAAFAILNGSAQVEDLAAIYFAVRIWGAPVTLASYAVLGWLFGTQSVKSAVATQIATNLINIALSLLFVLGFGWGVAGVAAGTVVAEVLGVAFAVVLVRRRLTALTGAPTLKVERRIVLDRAALVRLAAINADIFVRTLCLVFAFAWFTDRSAAMGDVLLAANAALQQLIQFTAFALDGFAFAAEALVGQAVGAARRDDLIAAIRTSTIMAAVVAVAFAGCYAVLGGAIVDLLTDLADVRAAARDYLFWIALMPLVAVWSFQLDGIFIGATRSREMRNAMLVTLAIYLAFGYWAISVWDNHGLWAALVVLMVARTATLTAYMPRVLRAAAQTPD